MAAAPALSVVIPTLPSRGHYLERCLRALAECEGREAVEVLVVSEEADEVGAVIGDLETDVTVRVVRGPAPAARKRNAGALEARARVIAFLDDDTRPERGWVRGLLEAFEEGAHAAAGRVVPDFEAPVPSFLRGREDVIRGFNALGAWRREGFVIGCNIAFRRSVFERVGLFNPDFGRRGIRYNTADESEFVRRVGRIWRVRYVEGACVLHAIQARRLTKGYLYGRAWWAGRAHAGMDEITRRDFVRNVWSVGLLLPVLVVRALARPLDVRPRVQLVHSLSYLLEGIRLGLLSRDRPAVAPRMPERA
jgi:glycosyltransferase involved in cell wall biosynthesis